MHDHAHRVVNHHPQARHHSPEGSGREAADDALAGFGSGLAGPGFQVRTSLITLAGLPQCPAYQSCSGLSAALALTTASSSGIWSPHSCCCRVTSAGVLDQPFPGHQLGNAWWIGAEQLSGHAVFSLMQRQTVAGPARPRTRGIRLAHQGKGGASRAPGDCGWDVPVASSQAVRNVPAAGGAQAGQKVRVAGSGSSATLPA